MSFQVYMATSLHGALLRATKDNHADALDKKLLRTYSASDAGETQRTENTSIESSFCLNDEQSHYDHTYQPKCLPPLTLVVPACPNLDDDCNSSSVSSLSNEEEEESNVSSSETELASGRRRLFPKAVIASFRSQHSLYSLDNHGNDDSQQNHDSQSGSKRALRNQKKNNKTSRRNNFYAKPNAQWSLFTGCINGTVANAAKSHSDFTQRSSSLLASCIAAPRKLLAPYRADVFTEVKQMKSCLRPTKYSTGAGDRTSDDFLVTQEQFQSVSFHESVAFVKNKSPQEPRATESCWSSYFY